MTDAWQETSATDSGDLEPSPPPQWAVAGAGALEAGVGRARIAAHAAHESAAWAWARRYLPVYRWATDLDDKTITVLAAGGWLVWLAGGVVSSALGLPGAPVVGALLAVAMIVVDAVGVRWWMGYRRAPARLRHEILARDQIAAGREIADSSLAAAQVVALGEQMRPVLAARLSDGGTDRFVRREVTMTGPVGGPRPVRPGELPACPVLKTLGSTR
jgi:hypothetical protein